jgi:CDP-paratose 2-epimerase
MDTINIINKDNRYDYQSYPYGISEDVQLDFHSPYGCSKGAADQYVRDYSRIFNLPTVVLRQSCIYGPNQFGIEDQGWVAWFTIATALGKNITIYGDGMQIRDVLYVSDLIDLYQKCITNKESCTGKVYNVGGGPAFTMSLLELVDYLRENSGHDITPSFSDWRPGDQRVFISDIRKLQLELGWRPKITPQEGVKVLTEWVKLNLDSITAVINS